MPDTFFGFDSEDTPKPVQVENTRQLEPRTTGHGPYATGDNPLKQYGKDHPAFGTIGDRCMASQQPKGKTK